MAYIFAMYSLLLARYKIFQEIYCHILIRWQTIMHKKSDQYLYLWKLVGEYTYYTPASTAKKL